MSRAIEWILLGAGSCLAIVVGIMWRRPARVGPWLSLAGSVASLAIGDILHSVGSTSAAEAAYLLMFVLVAATLLQFTRGGSLLVDRARLIDLLAFACAASLVVWVFTIGASGPTGEISAADVIGDLLLIGVATRLVIAAGRNLSAALLLAGSAGMLVSDVVYPLAPGPLTEAGYVVLYLTWGLAALHPSMTRLTEPGSARRPAPWRGRWAALLAASVATPPLVLLIEALEGFVRDGVVIAVAGGITLLLTITRLADSVSQHSRAAIRERALRTASSALVAAAHPPAVDEAVRAAVARLMPPRAVRSVVFATDDRHLRDAGLTTAPPDPRPPSVKSPIAGPRSALPTHGSPAGETPRSWWLDEDGADGTLVCPLWLEPTAMARLRAGALVLTAARETLTSARDSLEVLAGQAALALDRITLVEAVARRDSDRYLRTVVGNSRELMLVIDHDQRIRYASPAVHDLLADGELSPLATLTDLVHPDDRGQVRRAFQSSGDGTLYCALRRPDDSQVLVEATYRDLREDQLVQGFVVTMRKVAGAHHPVERLPRMENVDELPAWVNRRSAQHRFRH